MKFFPIHPIAKSKQFPIPTFQLFQPVCQRGTTNVLGSLTEEQSYTDYGIVTGVFWDGENWRYKIDFINDRQELAYIPDEGCDYWFYESQLDAYEPAPLEPIAA